MGSLAPALLILVVIATPALADRQRLALLPLELLDDTAPVAGQPPDAEHRRRLDAITERLRGALAALEGVTLVHPAQVDALLRTHPPGAWLHACNGCELDLGLALGAERVVIGWVQKVSNLILNLNLVVRQVDTGQTVAVAFVDLRGDNDRSWMRAMDYLIEHLLLPRLQPGPR